MTLVLTRRQMLSCIAKSRSGNRLEPRMLADGRQGVAEGVASLAAYSDIAAILAAGSVETVANWSSETGLTALLDSKRVTFNNNRRSYSISEPADNVFRQEMRANDWGTPTDPGVQNRRCEIVSNYEDGWQDGETLWMSFAVILSSSYSATPTGNFGFVMQVHPKNTSRPLEPCCSVSITDGVMRILTASDDAVSEEADGYGLQQTRWSTTAPAAGVITRFVMSVKLGQAGHLKAWVNGAVVYDADCPIGYWVSSSSPIKGYPQWGIYRQNANSTECAYHANIEWGSASLAARAASPLAVPDLSPWA